MAYIPVVFMKSWMLFFDDKGISGNITDDKSPYYLSAVLIQQEIDQVMIHFPSCVMLDPVSRI
jgi:hypothetical protein